MGNHKGLSAGVLALALTLAVSANSIAASGAAIDTPRPLTLDRAGEERPPESRQIPIEELRRYIREHLEPDVFGGMWLAEGERVVIALAGDIPDTHRQALQAMAPGRIDLLPVEYSLTVLEQKQREIEQAMEDLSERGIRVVTVGVNLQKNRVEVGILPFHEAHVQEMIRRFGDDQVEVVEGQEVHLMPAVVADDADADATVESAPDGKRERPHFLAWIVERLRNLWKLLFR